MSRSEQRPSKLARHRATPLCAACLLCLALLLTALPCFGGGGAVSVRAALASSGDDGGALGANQGILPVGLSAESATAVTISRLESADSSLNGTLVSFRGEVVGEAVNSSSPGSKWVVLQSGSPVTSSIEVLMSNDQAALIENFGSYKVKGSTLLVTGIYRVADPDQDGELDVTAYVVNVVDPGGPIAEAVDWRKLPVGIALVLLGLGLLALRAVLKWRVALVSKASSHRNRSQRRGIEARAARPHADKSRVALYGEADAVVEEPTGAEARFEPDFSDFAVPDAIAAAFAEFVECQEADGEADGCREVGAPLELGRVIRLDRGYPLVSTRLGSFRSEHAIALVKGTDTRAAVGDWVALRLPSDHDKARIERLMPRLSELSRWDGSNRGERQVLAANLDVLIVAQPLSKRDVPLDRIVRSVVLANEGNIRPAVALTKADRSPSEERLVSDAEAVRLAVGPDVDVVVVSSLAGEGIDAVRDLIPVGGTALLLGESGAGKSTLVNALLGEQVLGVGEVRGRDDQGRHTTVARRMLKVPGAGVLVDAPGLRSLPLLDETRGLAKTYPEITELVPGCRFRDCTHADEPGCAVRAAVERGEVDGTRLEEYRLLAAEMLANRRRLDPSAKASITV